MLQKFVKLSKLVKAFNFDVIYSGRDQLERKITLPTVHVVGTELTGFFINSDELNRQLHIFGTEEMSYIYFLSKKQREERLKSYFSYKFPCIIVAGNKKIHPDFIKYAIEYDKPLLSITDTITVVIRKLKYFLQRKLAPEININNYVLIEILGIGVLISGYEDARVGTTIELIERGHKFITDENLIIKKIGAKVLLGENGFNKSNIKTHFYLGTDNSNIDITNNYGLIATRKTKEINLLVNLEKWDEKKFYERLGLDKKVFNILGVDIPKITLPVRKGRNLAVIIETAAINERLKQIGVNSAEYFFNETKKLIAFNKEKKKGGNMKNKMLTIKKIVDNFNFRVITGEELLESTFITKTSLHNPALALSGFYEEFNGAVAESLQVFSQLELNFLKSLDQTVKIKNLKNFFKFDFPAMIVANCSKIEDDFIALAKKNGKIILLSEKTSTQLTADLNLYLEKKFAAKITMHGVFIEMFGFGVLLTGKSGIGKSETALELIHKGHRLITDDKVTFHEHPSGILVGLAGKIPYFMELRGIGIIDIKSLYGLGSVRSEKRLDVIIELKELKNDDYLAKTLYKEEDTEILGYPVNSAELYISSGRNAATMVEAAIMNLIAKKFGYNSEKAYKGKKRHSEFLP